MTERHTPPRLLMCRPTHFAVAYAINPWMDPASWARSGRLLATAARGQWNALTAALRGLGVEIELVQPEPGLPDLVFTANAAVVLDGTALLARFRHPERQGEEAPIERAFHALRRRGIIDGVQHLPVNVALEGAGDCVWDARRKLFWMGYGPRSDRAARAVVADVFGQEAVALALAEERFYHVDTALCPLPGGEILYFPGAFTAAGLRDIHERVSAEERIEIDAADAGLLAANAVAIDRTIILSRCSDGLRRRLEERGYRVIEIPLDAFLRSGGSAFCLTLRLDRRSAVAEAAGEARRRAG